SGPQSCEFRAPGRERSTHLRQEPKALSIVSSLDTLEKLALIPAIIVGMLREDCHVAILEIIRQSAIGSIHPTCRLLRMTQLRHAAAGPRSYLAPRSSCWGIGDEDERHRCGRSTRDDCNNDIGKRVRKTAGAVLHFP